jgi:hypothetical protein
MVQDHGPFGHIHLPLSDQALPGVGDLSAFLFQKGAVVVNTCELPPSGSGATH